MRINPFSVIGGFEALPWSLSTKWPTMPNKYETKTNPQLIKILRSRSLSLKGTKSERVQRLLDADEAHAARTNQLDLGPSLPLQNDGRPTVPNLPDLFSLSPHLYLLYDSNLRMSGTMIRLQKTLPKKGISASLQNIRSSWWFALLWEKIAHGRKLPALVQRGRVVGVCESLSFCSH